MENCVPSFLKEAAVPTLLHLLFYPHSAPGEEDVNNSTRPPRKVKSMMIIYVPDSSVSVHFQITFSPKGLGHKRMVVSNGQVLHA